MKEQREKKKKEPARPSIYIDPELLNQIDEYRFENRISSRNAAIIKLIQKGLEAEKKSQDRT